MANTTLPFLSVDDMLMGEILLSLKQDSPAPLCKLASEPLLPNHSSKMIQEAALPPSFSNSSAAHGFSLDTLCAVNPMAYTPRVNNKRYSPIVQLQDLRECFNLPIAAVARKFGICATLLKKICRRHGIQRWPHRQIRSLQKSIDMLRESLRGATGTNREYIAQKIAAFEYTLECIMQHPNTAAKGISAGRLASPATEGIMKSGNRVKNRQKEAARSMTQGSVLNNDESTKGEGGPSSMVEPLAQKWAISGASAQRLNTCRVRVPMSLQSILC